jgi:hypothetical protein
MKLNQLRSLIKEEIEKKLSENEETTKKVEVTPEEKEKAEDILGGDEINEASFGKVRDRLLSALKKGAVTLGVLTAVLGSPKLAQAQKDVLKKDIKKSTWFKSEVEKVGNKGGSGEYMHRWVNDLGQDSTEYVLHLGGDDSYYDRGASMTSPSRPEQSIDSTSKRAGKLNPNKLNIGDQSYGSTTVTMKGGKIKNFLWAKGYSNEWTARITPRQYKELQKLEELVKDVEYRSEDFWKIVVPVGKEIMNGNNDNAKIALDYFVSDYGTPQSTNKTNNKPFYSPNFVD